MWLSGTCLRGAAAACLALAVAGTAGTAAAAVWTEYGLDTAGNLRYARGFDEEGAPLHLAYGAEEREGVRTVTALYQRRDESLTVRSSLWPGGAQITYGAVGGSLSALLEEAGGQGSGFLALVLPGGDTQRIRLDHARSVVEGSVEAAESLLPPTSFTDLARHYLRDIRDLPVEPPWTADPLLEPVLLPPAAPDTLPGDGGSMGPAVFECWKECVKECPDDCEWLCRDTDQEKLCTICLASCSMGCGIGCGCFACGDLDPLIGPRNTGGPGGPAPF